MTEWIFEMKKHSKLLSSEPVTAEIRSNPEINIYKKLTGGSEPRELSVKRTPWFASFDTISRSTLVFEPWLTEACSPPVAFNCN
jgi:hypothetical protein